MRLRLRLRVPQGLARWLPSWTPFLRHGGRHAPARPTASSAAPEAVARAAAMGLAPPEVDEFPAMPWLRKLLIVGLAVTTAGGIFWTMLERPGAKPGPDGRLLQSDTKRCAPGQAQDCVGGVVQVIVPAVADSPASGAAEGR